MDARGEAVCGIGTPEAFEVFARLVKSRVGQ